VVNVGGFSRHHRERGLHRLESQAQLLLDGCINVGKFTDLARRRKAVKAQYLEFIRSPIKGEIVTSGESRSIEDRDGFTVATSKSAYSSAAIDFRSGVSGMA
jgi:hypothetical protein